MASFFFGVQGPPPMLKLDFGLWARVPQRFALPKNVTSGCLSPRSLFPPGQRFPIPKHVTSGSLSPRSLFPNWSAVSPPKPHDFRFRWRHFRSCDFPLSPRSYWSVVSRNYAQPHNQSHIRTGGVYANYRGKILPMSPHYYSNIYKWK